MFGSKLGGCVDHLSRGFKGVGICFESKFGEYIFLFNEFLVEGTCLDLN